jgi:hypothetical protein
MMTPPSQKLNYIQVAVERIEEEKIKNCIKKFAKAVANQNMGKGRENIYIGIKVINILMRTACTYITGNVITKYEFDM